MRDIDIYELLLKKHMGTLKEMLPYLVKDRFISPANKNHPVKEGIENKEYNGIMILQNGSSLINDLVRDGLVEQKDIDDPIKIDSEKDFLDFLNEREEEDGVYIYEKEQGELYRICHINCPHAKFDKSIPSDFVFSKYPRNTEVDRKTRLMMGTKTRLGLKLTQVYKDIKAYGIKRSGYTKLGMGKVIEADNDGLRKEFFFSHYEAENPEKNVSLEECTNVPYYLEKGILGIRRNFEKKDERFRRNEEIIYSYDLTPAPTLTEMYNSPSSIDTVISAA